MALALSSELIVTKFLEFVRKFDFEKYLKGLIGMK